MNRTAFDYFSYFFLSFVLSLFLTPIVRSLAFKIGMISYPRPDRWHKNPTALLGGISIYLASLISMLVFGLVNKNVLVLLIGATVLFIVGLFDDKFHFAPYIKLFAQIIAGSIAVIFGIILPLPINAVFAIPLTLFWIIAITNAFNLLDNIDGLAAGIAAISAFMIFVSSLLFLNNPLGILGLVLLGSCLGFLPHNFNPSKIFMGDSGSMFLGYSLAVISVCGTEKNVSNLLITLIIPVLILSVPIFDTIFVMIIRSSQGKKIFQGGKDHTSHHLVSLGLSPRKTVLLLYVISIIFGCIGILYSKANWFFILVIGFLAAVILLFFGAFLFERVSSNGKSPSRFNTTHSKNTEKTVLNNMFMHKRRIVEVIMDLMFIFIAYYSAYYLRFESHLLPRNLALMQESLIWIMLIKISIFFLFGLYRGVWRYIGISDFLTMFKVVTLSSIVSILFLTFVFRFKDYSRAVFFIDWLILLFLITGSRFLFRIIGEFFSGLSGGGKKILIFGAGDMGEVVIREIKRNRALNYSPVGFVDDDPSKFGVKIQGLAVLGPRTKIKQIIQEKDIQEVIIAIPSIDQAVLSEISSICKDCGIIYKKVRAIFDSGELDEVE